MLCTPSGNARIQAEREVDFDECPKTLGEYRVVRIGRVRVPITLTVAPWATLYRFPDGRLLWCLRLWDRERAATRCVSTPPLRGYVRESGFSALAAEIDELCERAKTSARP